MALRPSAAVAALACLALVAALPQAGAHTSVFTEDGKYRVVVGQLNEPVVTYAKTGLDVCFQSNDTARTPLAGVNPGGLTATLVSPGGERLSRPLTSQFGRTGCFQFQDPYILTEAGPYTVDLSGDLNGTQVSFTGVAAGGAVKDQGNLTFPHSDVADLRALQAANAALESRIAALQAELATLHASSGALEARVAELEEGHEDGGTAIPAPAALVPVALVAAAAVLRRRGP